MSVKFSEMKVGTKYKFVEYAMESMFQYTPGEAYEAVDVPHDVVPYISCKDNRGATPREEYAFVFEAV